MAVNYEKAGVNLEAVAVGLLIFGIGQGLRFHFDDGTGFGKVLLVLFICLVVLAVLLFAAFMAAAHWAPELLDTILYTPEELEILNY